MKSFGLTDATCLLFGTSSIEKASHIGFTNIAIIWRDFFFRFFFCASHYSFPEIILFWVTHQGGVIWLLLVLRLNPGLTYDSWTTQLVLFFFSTSCIFPSMTPSTVSTRPRFSTPQRSRLEAICFFEIATFSSCASSSSQARFKCTIRSCLLCPCLHAA